MEYSIQNWKIIDLINLYRNGNLILDPPYQRNFIWSKKDQDELIDSILSKRFPLPSFFLRKILDDKYEMVDGQQRTRTILSFYKRNYENNLDLKIIEDEKNEFEQYKLSITIINDFTNRDSIEDFYARVNKTGRKLNKPELNKAEFFYTEFLELNSELAGSEIFKRLELFTDSSTNRMNDIDFVSELVAQIEFGNFDKKDKVDFLYEKDISFSKKEELKKKFYFVIDKISSLNILFPLKKTRYKQRNDFFTLFGFIHQNYEVNLDVLKEFYKILILIGDEISPSNSFCPPFKEYAINCVSQSNQKSARDNRLSFFYNLFINTTSQPNDTQIEIVKFYELTRENGIRRIDKFLTLNVDSLKMLKPNLLINE